jgi:hypothetical protein
MNARRESTPVRFLAIEVSVMTMPRDGVVVASAGREFHLPAGAPIVR